MNSELMSVSKMLEVIEHNWGLKFQGDWHTVTWIINYDMSYSITVEYVPEWNPDRTVPNNTDSRIINGIMDKSAHDELREQLEIKQWRDPDIQINACDGVAYQIIYYSADGKTLNSSGKLGYIYGEEVLENIVNMLPKTEKMYDAPAFVSVSKKS